MVDNKLLTKLSKNLLEILNDEEYYDITIEVGNDPYVKVFRAHMVILYYRSPYLRRILSTNKKKNDGTLVHIKLPNILPETFDIILRYIYGGNLSLEEYDIPNIVKILVTANELSLQDLITHLQSFLIEKKESWIEQNYFSLIYQTSFEHDSFMELQKHCIDLISKNSDKIFESINFSLIPEKLLVALIQDGNLQMSEIQVWEHVLKWGLAQNPELPSDPTRFSKEDFDTLKKTLRQCIPFIKFHNLTSKEFIDKVIPYEDIFPRELYKDLIKTFLSLSDPSSKPNDKPKPYTNKEISIDSKIITYQHAKLISKWINKLELTKFNLLFRGSRDGFTAERFHELCDNRSHTVTISKVKGSSEIIGGYNPIEWKSYGTSGLYSSHSTTKDSFIFSFKNDDTIEDYVLSRVTNETMAAYNYISCGPTFGDGDLWTTIGKGCCTKNSYENPIRETRDFFFVEEFEVFQVVQD